MKELALSINGQQIPVPTAINHLVGGISGANSPGQKIIRTAIELLFIFAIIGALIFLIKGGFMWLTSEGDKQKVAAAQKQLIYTILGLSIIFLSFLIINILSFFFGFDLLGQLH